MAAVDYTKRQFCAVQTFGSDDAGLNPVGAPQARLTIAAALADLAANYPPATATNFHIVTVGPGVFPEVPTALPPWTFIDGTCDGEGQPTTFISFGAGGGLSLSAGWSANAAARGGLSNISLIASAGAPILDFTMPVPVAGNPARTVEMFNVHHNLTSQIFEATGTGDVFRISHCKQYGTAADSVTIHGGTSMVDDFLSAAPILFGDVGGIAATIQAYGIYITSATGGVTFSTTTGAGVTARMGSSDNRNLTLNITGAGALAVSADAISIPLTANVFYTGTATTANLIRTTDSGGFAPGVGTFTKIIRTGNLSSTAWGTAGVAINDTANTFTDTNSAGAVAGVTCARSFGIPTFASAGGVTYAEAVNVYLAGAPVITGGTATRSWTLYAAAGNVFFAGLLVFGATTGGSISGTAGGALSLAAAGTNQSLTLTPSGTGNVVIAGGSSSAPGANGFGNLSSDTNFGLTLRGQGAIGDLLFQNKSGGVALVVPTGTQNTLLGGLTTNGVGVIQLPAATTSSGGITFGTDVNLFRANTNQLTLNTTAANNIALRVAENGSERAQFAFNVNLLVIDTLNAGHSIQLRSGNQTTALTLDSSQKVIVTAGKKFQIGNARVAGAAVQGGTLVITDSAGVDQQVLCV